MNTPNLDAILDACCAHSIPGQRRRGEAARTDVPALLRLVAVLREQRDAAHEEAEGNQQALDYQRKLDDAAALAALEGE